MAKRRQARRRRAARAILIGGVVLSAVLFVGVFWLVKSREPAGSSGGAPPAIDSGVILVAGRDEAGAWSQFLVVVADGREYRVYTVPPRTVIDVPGLGFQQAGKILDLGGQLLLDEAVSNLLNIPVGSHLFFDQGAIDLAAEQAGTVNFRTGRPLSTADGAVSLPAGENPMGSSRAVALFKASVADAQAGPQLQALFYQGLRDALAARTEPDRLALAEQLARRVDTDLDEETLTNIFMDMTAPGRGVVVQPLPVRVSGAGPSWYLEPVPDQIEALLSGSGQSTAVAVEIRNGNGQTGAVEAAASRLAPLNYSLSLQAEASGVVFDYTQIRCGSEALKEGERIRSVLGKGTLIKDEYLEKQQIIVIIGRDLGLAELEKR